MAKGYWVVFADVSDPEGHKGYIAASGKALAKYGARFIAAGGKVQLNDAKPNSRVIVVEIPDYAAALVCYDLPEYASAMKLLEGKRIACSLRSHEQEASHGQHDFPNHPNSSAACFRWRLVRPGTLVLTS